MKKSIIAMLISAVFLLSTLTPLLTVPTAYAVDPDDWYMTVEGVLDSDTYWLYPYATDKSLKIGFSKYGEMINTKDNVGLEYGAVDPFAPPAGTPVGSIAKTAWLQGWLVNITYFHRIHNTWRNVWATAQHSDATNFGGPWLRVDWTGDWHTTYGYEDPRDPGYEIGNYAAGLQYGGRKTNGTAVTDPITVLYDGPREFIALLRTVIYDHFPVEDIPLLEIRYTIVFNKVKKEVVLLKDLKTLVHEKYADEMKVQFSNRGEVDLGTQAHGYTSYYHFYTDGNQEGLPTVYDRDWVLNVTQDPCHPTNPKFANYSRAGPYPQETNPTYDLAVAIKPSAGYVWWAAFWPSLSDWEIDGWGMWWRSLTASDPHSVDAVAPRTEPSIPYYIGEWDFEMKPEGRMTMDGGFDQQQYRFVTIYGVTDLNDGDDANRGSGHSNVIDRETRYQLDEYFNPWDLQSAVHKETKQWVQYFTGTGTTTQRRPFHYVSTAEWDQYCVFAERVENLVTGELMNRREGDYSVTVNADGFGVISGLTSGSYKLLYSTKPDVADGRVWEWTTTQSLTKNVTLWHGNETMAYPGYILDTTWESGLGVGHGLKMEFPGWDFYLTEAGRENWTSGHMKQWRWDETDFKVFIEETYVSDIDNLHDPIDIIFDVQTIDGTVVGNITDFTIGNIWKNVTAPNDPTVTWPLDAETIHMLYLNHTLEISINVGFVVWTNETEQQTYGTLTLSVSYHVASYYREKHMGRQEWGVVGQHSHAVDSAGLSMVSAAFKNKQVEYGLAGADRYTSDVSMQMPWVMAKFGSGNTLADYYYHEEMDFRTALKNDWCRHWPITTSNMIGVGGPIANMLAWYGNDFTPAFFGIGQFTDYAPWENKISAITCWNKNAYESSNTVGYAVITTYKDINGTVLLLIWGHWGRDTYYITKWFHEEGIYQLQEAPAGITGMIVEIDYALTSGEGYKPTDFTVVELLGTISETYWKHYGEDKGGIHDP